MNGPGVRAFRGPRRPPIPSALLVDKHFEQWVTRGEGAKFSPTYTPEMQEGIRNTPKLFVFFCPKRDADLSEHLCFEEWLTRSNVK